MLRPIMSWRGPGGYTGTTPLGPPPQGEPLMAQQAPCDDLDADLANALIRELMEIDEDSRYWDASDWVTERAILNRIFRMGQCHARDKTETAAGKD